MARAKAMHMVWWKQNSEPTTGNLVVCVNSHFASLMVHAALHNKVHRFPICLVVAHAPLWKARAVSATYNEQVVSLRAAGSMSSGYKVDARCPRPQDSGHVREMQEIRRACCMDCTRATGRSPLENCPSAHCPTAVMRKDLSDILHAAQPQCSLGLTHTHHLANLSIGGTCRKVYNTIFFGLYAPPLLIIIPGRYPVTVECSRVRQSRQLLKMECPACFAPVAVLTAPWRPQPGGSGRERRHPQWKKAPSKAASRRVAPLPVPVYVPAVQEVPVDYLSGLTSVDLNADVDVSEKCAVYAYNLELKGLGKVRDVRGCLKLLRAMRSEGVRPDKYSYSTVLACCARKKNCEHVAFELYRVMCEEGVPVDEYILTNLLSIAAAASPPRLDICARLFRTPKRPPLIMCNVMMDAFARCGELEKCLRTFNYMGLRGISPDKYTVSALIKAYVKAGRLEEALERIKDMHAAGLDVSSTAFGQIMDAYGKAGAMDSAVAAFDVMVLFGIQPTQTTYNILIGACAYVRETDRAFELFEEMRHTTSACTGDRFTFHSLMKSCLSTGDGDRALQVYGMIKRSPFLPNQVSYRLALLAAGQSMNLDAAHGVADDMVQNSCRPRLDTAATLVAANIRCSDLKGALRFFGLYLNHSRFGNGVFDAIRTALEDFEASSDSSDHMHTRVVVDELERVWCRCQE